jgi:hypothetical protein
MICHSSLVRLASLGVLVCDLQPPRCFGLTAEMYRRATSGNPRGYLKTAFVVTCCATLDGDAVSGLLSAP